MEKCQGCRKVIRNDHVDILKLTKVFKTTKKLWHRHCEKEREDRIKQNRCILCKKKVSSKLDLICMKCFYNPNHEKYKGYDKLVQ